MLFVRAARFSKVHNFFTVFTFPMLVHRKLHDFKLKYNREFCKALCGKETFHYVNCKNYYYYRTDYIDMVIFLHIKCYQYVFLKPILILLCCSFQYD